MSYELYCGDCLDILPTLAAGSVDAVIADPPYGTTACAWDSIIPFAPMWAGIKHIAKPRAAVVLFGSQPFTSALVMSNPAWFRFEMVWDKVSTTNFGNSRIMPLKSHENIIVFYENLPTYNPQFGSASKRFGKTHATKSVVVGDYNANRKHGIGYPKSIVRFMRPNNLTGGGFHPTQKPLDLLRYLIRTYTNPGETVCDFTMGSGTTGVAAILEGRKFVGIELDAGYFRIAERRIADAAAQPMLFPIAETQPQATQEAIL